MITPVLGQGGAAHRRLLRLSSKASGGRRAAARGDRRSASCQACHRPALDRGRWRRAAGGNGERHCGAARRLLRISRVRKNPIAWKNQVFARYRARFAKRICASVFANTGEQIRHVKSSVLLAYLPGGRICGVKPNFLQGALSQNLVHTLFTHECSHGR